MKKRMLVTETDIVSMLLYKIDLYSKTTKRKPRLNFPQKSVHTQVKLEPVLSIWSLL